MYVPGGTFMMGNHDNGPVHQVTLSPYLIAKYQCTQAQWQQVMGSAPWKGKCYGKDGVGRRTDAVLLRPAMIVPGDACGR